MLSSQCLYTTCIKNLLCLNGYRKFRNTTLPRKITDVIADSWRTTTRSQMWKTQFWFLMIVSLLKNLVQIFSKYSDCRICAFTIQVMVCFCSFKKHGSLYSRCKYSVAIHAWHVHKWLLT